MNNINHGEISGITRIWKEERKIEGHHEEPSLNATEADI